MKKMLLWCGLIASIGVWTSGYAQEDQKTNSVYVELMGNGIVYSVGYEKTLIQKQKDLLVIRAGLCLYPESQGDQKALFKSLPVEIVSRGVHKNIEIGIGYTPFHYSDFIPVNIAEGQYTKEQLWGSKIYGRLGFISAPGKRGVFWKAAFVPDLYDSREKKNNILGFGFAIGKKF